jgi:hypothetical protein
MTVTAIPPTTIILARQAAPGMVRVLAVGHEHQMREIVEIERDPASARRRLHYKTGRSSVWLNDSAQITVVAEGFEF